MKYALLLLMIVQQRVNGQTNELTGKLTLKQCVEIALANNLQVNQSQFSNQSDAVNLQQAKGNRLPFVSGYVAHGSNEGRSIDPYTNSYIDQTVNFANYGLSASVYLWNGLSIQNNIKQNELNYKAGQMDLQQAKDNLTITVILAYLQVLNNKEQLNNAVKQANVSKNQVDRLAILNKDGATAPATYYDMKGQLANDELNIVSVKNSLESSKLTLVQLMNVSYAASMVLEPIGVDDNPLLYDASSDQIYQTALQQMSIVKAYEFRQMSAAKRVVVTKAQLLPSISLNGSLGTNYSSQAYRSLLQSTADVATNAYVFVGGNKSTVFQPQSVYNEQKISYGDQWKNNFNSSISLVLQVPILNGLQARSRLNQAKIQEKKAGFESQTTKTQLHQSIDQAYINMRSAFERYQTLQHQVSDFGESFRSAEIRFNSGLGTSVDYMVAKNNVDKANINLISAKYDYLLRVKILDYYQGKNLF